MVTRRSVLRLAGLLPLALAPRRAAAQAPAVQTASSAEWVKVVDAARKEGKVVMYSGAVGNTVSPKIAAAFEAKYGIRMEVLEARASELREQVEGVLYEWREKTASVRVPEEPEARLAAVLAMAEGLREAGRSQMVEKDMLPAS